MVSLTPLENGILGLMSWDAYGVGELTGHLRTHDMFETDADIFARLHHLLTTWNERGWLEVSPVPGDEAGVRDMAELLRYLDAAGPDIVSDESEVPLPTVELTEQAFREV